MNEDDRPAILPEGSMRETAEKAAGVACLIIGSIILITATSDTTAGGGVIVIVVGFTLLRREWRK